MYTWTNKSFAPVIVYMAEPQLLRELFPYIPSAAYCIAYRPVAQRNRIKHNEPQFAQVNLKAIIAKLYKP